MEELEVLEEEMEIEGKGEENNQVEHFEIINKIHNLEQVFNEVDDYFNSLSSLQSQNDEYIQDLLHYVEVRDFTQSTALKFVELLKEKRQRRRKLNRDFEIKRIFDNNRSKFVLSNQRTMAMANLYKKEKELTKEYKERQIPFEQIDGIISQKKSKKKEDV